jgi:ABC-type multidrug transport system ATPase subunit
VAAPAINVNSLEKWFPPAHSGWRAFLQPFARATTPALRGVSLEVAQGTAVALLGVNGAGKTTLLRILATLLLPTRGSAWVAGHDTMQDPTAVRRQLGYHAGSDAGFYPRLTGRENLRFFGRLNHLSNQYVRERIRLLGQQFQVEDFLDRQVRTLSAGTVQRLSLLRSLLHEPKVLLLDEPTRSLDAIATAEFRRFLRREVITMQGTSLLFASHSLTEIEQLADQVAVLQEGALIAFDTPSTLKANCSVATLEEVFFRLTGHAMQTPAETSPA